MSSTSTQLFPISVHGTEPGLTSKEAGPVALTGPQPVPPVIWSPKLTESAAMDPGSSCVLTLDTPVPTHPAMVDTVMRVGFNAVWLVVDGWLRVGAWTQLGGTLWSLSADLGGEALDAESGFDLTLTSGTWARAQLVVSDDQLVLLVNGTATVRIPVGERFTVPTTITSVTLQATDATRQLQVGAVQLTDDVPATVETATSTAERIGLGEVRGAFHRVGKESIGGEWGAETAIPGGRFQPYEFGAAYWSRSTGAVTVEGPVWERYVQMGTHASVLGRPLTDTQQGTARYATRTRDALATRGGDQSLMTRFEHGVIAWAEHTGAHEVVGRVAAHWLVLGGPASVVGLPVGPPTETARGYRHGFEFGEVFERYDGTVAEVHGGILERYDQLGLWDGVLGAPMTDETKVLADDGTDTGIRTNRFEHGAIYWTAARGAHELLDPWHAAYLDAGGPAGPLGLPTSPVRGAGALGVEYVEFEHGLMVRTPTMAPRLVDTVEVVLTEATAPSIDDGLEIGWDGISADRTAELMVWMSVLRNGEAVEGFDRKRFPDSGHASKHVDMHNARVLVPVDAATTITVIGAAEDWDSTPNDDALGGILRNYGIDTLWGELPAGGAHSETGSGGDGNVIYKYAIGLPAGPISPIFREHRWWQYTNGGTDDVSYPDYAQAFEDVEAHGSWWDTVSNPLDHLFYELAIRNIAEDGNCYGMSSLALRTILDETNFRLPLSKYGPPLTKVSDGAFPNDIRTELNIHHCQQLNSAVLGSILSRISLGPILNLRLELSGIGDGSTGDLAVISMVSILEGKGHAVLAYGYEPRPGFPDSILVADPNVPFAKNNAGHASRIEIDHGGGWQFFDNDKADADYSSGRGALLFRLPSSVVNAVSITPMAGLALGVEQIASSFVVVGGDAMVETVNLGGAGSLTPLPLLQSSPLTRMYAGQGPVPTSAQAVLVSRGPVDAGVWFRTNAVTAGARLSFEDRAVIAKVDVDGFDGVRPMLRADVPGRPTTAALQIGSRFGRAQRAGWSAKADVTLGGAGVATFGFTPLGVGVVLDGLVDGPTPKVELRRQDAVTGSTYLLDGFAPGRRMELRPADLASPFGAQVLRGAGADVIVTPVP